MRFDLLALDVDGTLVGTSGAVSPALASVLAEAQRQGIFVSLCTGRSLAATQRYLDMIEHPAPPVVLNGAFVPDLDGGPPWVCKTLDGDLVKEIVAHARQHGDFLELHTEHECFAEALGPVGERQTRKLGVMPVVGPFGSLTLSESVLKAQFVVPNDGPVSRLRELERRWAGVASFGWGVSPGFSGHFVNVLAAGCDKGAALDVVLDRLGIGWSRVLAAGDSPSDLTYILRAGHGLVMANAPQAVREMAPNLAPDIADGGLERVLPDLLF